MNTPGKILMLCLVVGTLGCSLAGIVSGFG